MHSHTPRYLYEGLAPDLCVQRGDVVSEVHVQHKVVPHRVQRIKAGCVFGLVELNNDITQLRFQFQELFE